MEPVFTAVANRDLKQLARWLTQNPKDARDLLGRSPLMCACFLQPPAPELVDLFIENGADLSARDHQGMDVMSYAVTYGDENLIGRLLNAGAPVEGVDLQGNSLLHLATRAATLPVISRLLVQGLDVNAANQQGITPLMNTCRRGQSDAEAIIRLLVDHGAHLDAKNVIGETALMLAADYDTHAMEVIVQQGASLTLVDNYGKDALIHAAASSTDGAHRVAFLLANGAGISSGGRALKAAVIARQLDTVKVLLEAGADKDAADTMGYTPLMEALMSHQLEIANYLVEQGANIHARTLDGNLGGQTVLGCALGVLDDLLFERGAPPPIPLSFAIGLLDRGVAVDAVDSAGCTALFYLTGNQERRTLLLDRGANVNQRAAYGYTPLMAAAAGGHVDGVADLLRRGADINTHKDDGHTALTFAINCGAVQVITALLEAGADIHVKLTSGITPLMQLSWGAWQDDKQRVLVARLLLKKGAKLDEKGGEHGRTALMHAVIGGKKPLVSLFLKHGASTMVQDDLGNTALDLADPVRHESIREELMKHRTLKA